MATKQYPLTKFHFSVEWGGTVIGFTEVSGLEVTTEKIEFRHGLDPEFGKSVMPGMKTYGEITLKRGIFKANNEFFEWWNEVGIDNPEPMRRDITISLLNQKHEPVVVWKVRNAWPTKVTSTDLNATGNEAAIETLVLAHEGLTMQNE